MGKHIPVIRRSLSRIWTGAGSVIAANYMYKAAKPDGLTIGHILGGLFLQQLLGNPAIEFDGRKFEYLGVPAQDHFLIGLSKATAITSFENRMASKTPLSLAAWRQEVPPTMFRKSSQRHWVPIKVVTGYKGTARFG